METVDCDPGSAVCEAMTVAVGSALAAEARPSFRLTHVYVGTEDDPGSSAGQAVLPAIAFANGRDDSGLHLSELRCWGSPSETYRCERP